MSNFEIRAARAEDAAPLADIYNYYVLNTHITFDLEPVTAEAREQWIQGYHENEIHRLFVGTDDGQVVGYASSSAFRPKPAYDRSVETTIYLSPESGGNGWGSRLYQHLLEVLDGTDVNRCYGIIALPNDASVALHKKFGFTEAGHLTDVGYKFEKYWDTLWLEKSM